MPTPISITPDPAIHNYPPGYQSIPLGSPTIQGFAQQLIQGIINAVLAILTNKILGAGQTISQQANDFFRGIFGGALSPIIDNLDGTATALQGFINHLDGTATYTQPVNSFGNPVYTLIDNVDGTAHDLATSLNNMFNPASQGTHNFAVSGWNQFIQGIGTPNIQQSVSSLSGLTTPLIDNLDGTATAIASGVSGIINNLDGTATQIVANAGTVVNSLFGGVAQLINNFDGTASTPAQAVANTANTANNLNAQMVAMQNKITAPVGSGLSVTVPFSQYANATTLPPIFTESYPTSGPYGFGGNPESGVTFGITSGTAKWQAVASTKNDFAQAIYTSASLTDYQIVTATFGSGSQTGVASDLVIGRSNATGTTYVATYVHAGQFNLVNVTGGVETVLTTSPVGPLYNISGDAVALACGTNSGIRNYQILLNGSPITLSGGLNYYNDSGAVTQVGSSFRYAGLAARQDQFAGAIPAPFNQWALADNASPPPLGSGFRQYRAAIGTSNWVTPSPSTAGSLNLLQCPASWFDTNDKITSDMVYTSSTNTLTISVTGWYSVTICIQVSTSAGSALQCGFFHNGSWANQIGTTGNWGSGSTPVLQGSFGVYCSAGDTLAPGMSYFPGAGFVPDNTDSTGQMNYFEVSLMNCGTLS